MRGFQTARVKFVPVVLFVCFLSLVSSPALLSTESVYRIPDQVLVDIIDAPRTPRVSIGPNREWMLLMERPGYPSIAELAERELRLAGLRIKPQINAPSRAWSYSSLSLLRISDLKERKIRGLPEKPRIRNISWAPDGSRIAFTDTKGNGVELWVVEVATGKARCLTSASLSLTAQAPPKWLLDGQALICPLVPAGRGPEPEAARVPSGPVIQENLGKTAPARTYQDLLKNAQDEALFEYYLTSQLVKITLDGTVTPLGDPGIIWDFDPSPNGDYLLVHILHRPFSYLVTAGRFPERIEVWDLDGNLVRQLADLPLREEIPITHGSVATGPRDVGWRHDKPATLCWARALDGGDAGAEADVRDRVFLLPAPFQDDPMPLITLSFRYGGIMWGNNDLACVSEWWWKTRNIRLWRVKPGSPAAVPELLVDRSWEDRYNDPGKPVMKKNTMGRSVLFTANDGKSLFLIGDGASPEGDRPFLDEFDLTIGKTKRLFRSRAPYYERPILFQDEEHRYLLTRRESVEEPPNYFVRDIKKNSLRQVTFFPHPTPQLAGIQKKLIRYQREDGIQLSATLYLPSGYKPEDGPLPMVMWAYPREFKSIAAAGQVADSPYRFNRVGWWSPLLWLTQGYAVLDGPTMPIIGEGDVEPNDTYVKQLVLSAKAAVDEVVRRGVAERGRIAIGGHSYGAFTAANLLAHSDLFAAGLARTGAYNRTLTPFGFQSEERTLWQTPEVYFKMSPFMHANKVNEPLLLVHGIADNNPGTFPLQSERFYNALKGLGATVRLVMLPYESHSYRARESILHLLWETQEWLKKYVKNAKPKKGEIPPQR